MKSALYITRPVSEFIYELKVIYRKDIEEEKEGFIIDAIAELFFNLGKSAEYIELLRQGAEECSDVGALTCVMYTEKLYLDLVKGGYLLDDQVTAFLAMIVANRKALPFDHNNHSYLTNMDYINKLGLEK